MSIIIEPEPGNVLVQLPESEHGDLPVVKKEHDSLTWGTVIFVNVTDSEHYGYLLGRVAHWRKYKDDARLGGNLALIEIRDILGTSYDTSSTDR